MTKRRQLYALHFKLSLRSPWLVHGNDPGRYGLSATQMRDHLGRLILPGSLLVGRIRAAWDEFPAFGLNAENPTAWFGQEGPEPDRRARLWVADLSLAAPAPDSQAETEPAPDSQPQTEPQRRSAATGISPRVALGEASGAAADAQLLLIEQNHPPGQSLCFTGTWRAYLDDAEAKRLSAALQAGLLWHSQLGAQRSVGFGELETASVEPKPLDAPIAPRQVPSGPRARLQLRIADPLCVAARGTRGNLFVSGDIISGGTLKGALAKLLAARHGQSIAELAKGGDALARHFDALRVSHAFPACGDARPAPLPLSLAAAGDTMQDLARWAEPGLLDGHAPSFAFDWKTAQSDRAEAAQGWGKTRPHLRVRTAIDPATRASKNEQLFAYECRVAEAETRWLADIALPDLPAEQRAALWQSLADLIGDGLGPIGKTDAFASASLHDTAPEVWPQGDLAKLSTGATLRLQLNTPALLFAAAEVVDGAAPDLHRLYADAFSQLSDGALALCHFYASQRMAGGGYLHHRHFRPRQAAQGRPPRYLPLVLSEAGSVFVLSVKDADAARACLARWRHAGLPLPARVIDEHGDGWQDHPYLPQNGYGEIAIDLQHGFPLPAQSTAR